MSFFLLFLYETLIRVWSVLTEAEVKVQAPLFHHPPPFTAQPCCGCTELCGAHFQEGHCQFPWRRRWHPTPVLLPRKSQEWRSLVGCSPWECKESDVDWVTPLHWQFQQDDELCVLSSRTPGIPHSPCLFWPKLGKAFFLSLAASGDLVGLNSAHPFLNCSFIKFLPVLPHDCAICFLTNSNSPQINKNPLAKN